jgi:uncharacterized protein (DUF58 family)
MTPTPRLVAIVLFTLPLAFVPMAHAAAWPLVGVLWVALVAAIALDLAVLSRVSLRAKLSRPTSVGVGTSFRAMARIDLGLPMALPASVRTETALPVETDEGVRPLRLLAGENDVPIELYADHRGRGALSALWLRIEGLLGLVARITRVDEGAGPIAVVPDVERVDREAIEVLGSEAMLSGMKRERWAGDGGEFESLSAYSLGMDMRAVDWKASARHMSIRVRRYRLERRQRIVLCLDLGREMRDPIDGLERLDHGVHTSLVLAKTALGAGDLVGLHGYGAEPRSWVPPRGGPAQFARLRSACAQLATEPDETNHVLGLHDLLRRSTRRSMIVVFTEFTDATTAELMLETIGQLARRHVIVFVALDDPTLEEPLVHAPQSGRALAAAVVASSLANRRHVVLARLARMGVHVVHSRPGAIAGALVERYVRIKSRGLIG